MPQLVHAFVASLVWRISVARPWLKPWRVWVNRQSIHFALLSCPSCFHGILTLPQGVFDMTSQGLVFPVLKVVKLDVYFLELSCPFLGFQVLSAMRSGNREGERDTTFSLCILLPSCTNLSGKPDSVTHVTPFAKTDHSNTASTKLTENYGKLGACRCTGSYVQTLPVPFLWDWRKSRHSQWH